MSGNNENKTTENTNEEVTVSKGEARAEELQTAITDHLAEIEQLHTLAADQEKAFEAVKAELEAKVEELTKGLASVTEQKDILANELKNIKEEALLKERLSALSNDGLLRENEEARVKQAEKIKSMTDEAFTEYHSELLEVKNLTQAAVKTEDLISSALASVEESEEKERLKNILSNFTKPKTTEAKEAAEETEETTKEVASTTFAVPTLTQALGQILKFDKERY